MMQSEWSKQGMIQRATAMAVTVAFCLSAFLASADAQDIRRAKKLIEVGWDTPDSETLPGILDEVEKQPFDGLGVRVVGRKSDGAAISLGYGFIADKWEREWFQPGIDKLRSCKFRRFTDNFVMFYANPGNVDWFDDAGWMNIVEHWRIAAWVARQSGFKGICFDPEPYSQPHAQFQYSAQPGRGEHTFAEYSEKARQRGREVMTAITEEYPDITILSFYLNSVVYTEVELDPRHPPLASLGYGLLPAVLNGWLDVATPAVTIVDGWECSYLHNSREMFLESANLIRNSCQDLVAPENRAKYRSQVQVSFGIYMDAYWNPKENTYYIDGGGKPRVERLAANVRNALSVADEYVWVYGERFRWWPTTATCVQPQTWPEALPGCDHALRRGRDPIGYAREEAAKLRASGQPVNLARNGDFSSDKSKSLDGQDVAYSEDSSPAGWRSWQNERSKGTFAWDRQKDAANGPPGAARLAGVADGCLLQDYRVNPGERYAISAVQLSQGKGNGTIRIRWQAADGTWLPAIHDVCLFPHHNDDQSSASWSKLGSMVEVPDGAGRLMLLLTVSLQENQSDVIWFDNIEVYKLP